MMKAIFSVMMILAGFLLSSPVVLGQSKFAFSATIVPYYGHTHNKTTLIYPDPNGGAPVTSLLESRYPGRGFYVGLNGRYSFSPKWSFSTGLWLNQTWLKAGLTTNTPAIIEFSGRDARAHNFSIPVMVNFQTSGKKLSPYLSAGALYNFPATSHMYIPDFGSVTFKSEKNTSGIAPMVGAGVIYSFAQHLSLIAQPTFQYVIPHSGIHSQSYKLNFNVQLMYRF